MLPLEVSHGFSLKTTQSTRIFQVVKQGAEGHREDGESALESDEGDQSQE